ncbi:BRCA1-associated RING domain protein 1 [Quercus robur]|uniref:BRCA1-associated RING domain protein 1 n=1 Tax=Quercus robur TaxID=38942 RepID=UPI002161F128|nr:BRCA1-associated RING domain protein 1 [Quercus robur]
MEDSMNMKSDRSSSSSSKTLLINPWLFHYHKLALELKCPLCLNLLRKPMLLPCNHIFCSCCIPISAQVGSDCSVCKAQYFNKDLRIAPFIENLVTIFRGLEATYCSNLFQPVSSDSGRVLEQGQASLYTGKFSKESVEGAKSSSGQSVFSLTANKRVQVPLNLNCSVEDGVGKNDKFENYNSPVVGKGGREGDKFNGAVNMNPPSDSLPMRPGNHEECRVVEIEMNQGAQSLPDSPLSFSDAKGSDDDSCDRGSEHSPENSLSKGAMNKNSEDRKRLLRHERSGNETEDGHSRDIKKQKKLNDGSSEFIPSVVSHSEISVAPNSELELESRVPPVALQHAVSNKSICAFCQSSKVSETSGPMLHYANGKKVVGDEATHSNVIHVHTICIDWAPQVYYDDNENVKNLKAEVARGAKLKCSRCGKKGAALGCYMKSCRKSYHVPCAAEIANCRWDNENFLMLCPAHSSVRFPNEKPKSGKQVLKDHPEPIQKATQQYNGWEAPSDGAKEWVLCGSALSTEERILVVKFASMCGATVTKFWKPNVTHVIAATDAQGACTRTLKVLMAILNGRWILKIDWIKACMEAMHPVNEEPYEVGLDNHGCCDGPKTGRLLALNNAPKLFNGLKFYFTGGFVPEYEEDLCDLVMTAGGTVLKSKEELVPQSCDGQAKILVVYNLDPPQGSKVGEEVDILWKRLTEAQDVAANIGSQVIGHTWLLESIAACELQPLFS